MNAVLVVGAVFLGMFIGGAIAIVSMYVAMKRAFGFSIALVAQAHKRMEGDLVNEYLKKSVESRTARVAREN